MRQGRSVQGGGGTSTANLLTVPTDGSFHFDSKKQRDGETVRELPNTCN